MSSGWPDLHGRLLSVREMLFCLSYILVVPSAPSGTLTLLRLASPLLEKFLLSDALNLGESDGRCVHASEPASEGHSCFLLLLNPPSGTGFIVPFVCSAVENVAHFFPPHALHLDLTFWAVLVLLTLGPSKGKLTTAVYRRVWPGVVRLNGGYRF